jgi:hypothetical protein
MTNIPFVDNKVTDEKIGDRTLLDNVGLSAAPSVEAGRELTNWLQALRDGEKGLFEGKMSASTRGITPSSPTDSLADKLKGLSPVTGFYSFNQATEASGGNRYADFPLPGYGGWVSLITEAINNDRNFQTLFMTPQGTNDLYIGSLNNSGITWRKATGDFVESGSAVAAAFTSVLDCVKSRAGALEYFLPNPSAWTDVPAGWSSNYSGYLKAEKASGYTYRKVTLTMDGANPRTWTRMVNSSGAWAGDWTEYARGGLSYAKFDFWAESDQGQTMSGTGATNHSWTQYINMTKIGRAHV